MHLQKVTRRSPASGASRIGSACTIIEVPRGTVREGGLWEGASRKLSNLDVKYLTCGTFEFEGGQEG